MASLSSEYILYDVEEKEGSKKETRIALRLSLLSAAGGSTDPLMMADTKDAERMPVLIRRLVHAWN